jgi:hypothetical protein
MKKMMYLLAIVSTGIFASCTQEEVTTDGTSIEAFVIDYMTDADTQIAVDETLAASDPNAVSAFLFSSNAASGRDPKGGKKKKDKIEHPSGVKGDSIAFKDLPAAAQTYITANNGGVDSVKSVLKITLPDGTIAYSVRFLNGKHTHFDANGAVVVKQKDQFTTIAFADLPTAVQTYLNANIDVAKIAQITKRTTPSGTVTYQVRLTDNTRITLDEKGNLIVKPTGNKVVISFTELPAAVQTYLNANTTVANISAVTKSTRPDGKIVYEVKFTDGKRISLDENGNVVKGKKKG